MKKHILALAVAAAVLPLSAQAEVTLYGQIHESIDYIDHDFASNSYWDATSRSSRIGFKGSEDLGGDLKMIWQFETTVNVSEGGWGSGRNSFIGLAGGWGTFLYGKHDTPVKMSTAKLDLFSDELGDNDANLFADIRANDAIAYVSPAFGGFTFAAAVVPDGDYDCSSAIDDNGDGFTGICEAGGDFGYSLAGMFSSGAFYLGGGYEDLGDLLGGADADHWRLGGGFDMGSFHIGAIYEDGTSLMVADDYTSYQLSGSFAFGNNLVKAAYGNLDSDLFDQDFDTWAIGLDHNFTKRSKMYVQYADSEYNLKDVNWAGEQSGFSFGMVHKF